MKKKKKRMEKLNIRGGKLGSEDGRFKRVMIGSSDSAAIVCCFLCSSLPLWYESLPA